MSRLGVVAAGLFAAASLVAPAAGASAPPGATAQCRDGSYSYSQHHSGTCSYHGGVAAWLDGSMASSSSGPSTASSSGSVNVGVTVLLAHRRRTGSCTRGARPDRRCSPGAYYSGLTKAVICSPSFRTSTIRNVPQSEKFQVEGEYGMSPSYYGYTIEIDHIVSLELGGSNTIANLFPEPGSGKANYHVKDALENKLHDLVCSGAMMLHAAQREIASNWEALYRQVFGRSPP